MDARWAGAVFDPLLSRSGGDSWKGAKGCAMYQDADRAFFGHPRGWISHGAELEEGFSMQSLLMLYTTQFLLKRE